MTSTAATGDGAARAVYVCAMRWLNVRRARAEAPPDRDVARLEVLDGDTDPVVGRPERWPRPSAREVAYAGPHHDPGSTAGLWSAAEHL